MDHFTHNIIRMIISVVLRFLWLTYLITGHELRAMTAIPAPSPSVWAFAPENNLIFASHEANEELITPEDWVTKRGLSQMRVALTF